MKKILISIFLAMPFMPTLHAREHGQTQHVTVSGGPLVEMNTTGFIHSGFIDGASRMKTGITVGGFVNFCISHHFSIQGEMAFMHKHSDFHWESGGGCYRYWGMEIPVYAMYHSRLGNGGMIYAGIGPYTNFGLDAKFKNGGKELDLYEKDASTGLPPMKDSDTGFGIKAGYEFPCGLQLNASYKASISNVIDSNSSRVKMHPHTISFGVAWRFGK